MARAARASVLFATCAVLASREARADDAFVDRPLTLPPLHFSADAGIGFGQAYSPGFTVGAGPAGAVVVDETSVKLGWGANLEAAVGLPVLGEVGVRVGVRFGDPGIDAGQGFGADHFARLFDPVVAEPGDSSVTNPEIHLRGTVFDRKVVELGLETRAIIPTDSTSDFELVPGAPLRIHLPSFARIDTGIWLPIAFDSDVSFTVDIPAQHFFQAGQAFFGPMTGVRYNHPGGEDDSSVDVPVGVAGGYTLGGILDLKVQVRTERINDVNWSKFIGGGFGAGLRLP